MLEQSLSYLSKYTDYISSARPRLAIFRGINALLNGACVRDHRLSHCVQARRKMSISTSKTPSTRPARCRCSPITCVTERMPGVIARTCAQALALYYRGAFVPSKESSKMSEQSRDVFKSIGVIVPSVAEQLPPFIDQWRINASLHKMTK
jgi:hypothetical protein